MTWFRAGLFVILALMDLTLIVSVFPGSEEEIGGGVRDETVEREYLRGERIS